MLYYRWLGFSKFALQVAIFLQFMLQFMQIAKDIAYFPDNYRSCFNLCFNLWPNLLFTVNIKCEYTIHERYDFYTQ